MRRAPALLACVAAALTLALPLGGCVVCDRPTAADGRYRISTDCAGHGLVEGPLAVGAFTSTRLAGPCAAGDAGTDCAAGADESACPETAAGGAAALGLPSQVRVKGAGDFELYGEVGGRSLDCAREGFGDERVLFCRSQGRVACTAVVAR